MKYQAQLGQKGFIMLTSIPEGVNEEYERLIDSGYGAHDAYSLACRVVGYEPPLTEPQMRIGQNPYARHGYADDSDPSA